MAPAMGPFCIDEWKAGQMKLDVLDRANEIRSELDLIMEILADFDGIKIRDSKSEFFNRLPNDMIDRQYEEREAHLKGRIKALQAEFEAL